MTRPRSSRLRSFGGRRPPGARPLGVLALLAALAAACLVWGRAEPARADDDSTSKKVWMLKFEHDHPERISIGHEPEIQNFWYLTFTLTNEDPTPHQFFLEIWAESDKGVVQRSIVQPNVLARVRSRLGLRPFDRLWSKRELTTAHPEQPMPPELPTEIRLPTIPARESVRCVAIFEGYPPEMDAMRIMVRGLTNDVIVKKTGRPHERVLGQRVLVLEYRRPGDEFYAQEDPVEFVRRRWEILEDTVKTDLE